MLDAVAADAQTAGLTGAESEHVQARLEIERGRLLNSAGSADDAKPHFEAAYDHAIAAGLEAACRSTPGT